MKVRFFNIVWETDGEVVELPKDITFDVEDDRDPSEDGADILSEWYGWLVKSFNYEVLKSL